MSLVEHQSTPARVAASQANGRKSKGPATPEGKARASLNSLKTGAYAKTDKARREIMLRRGENPDDFDQLHREFTEEWQPGYVTEAMLVKAIAEKSFDQAQLRAAWMESQLNSLRIAEVQAERRQLLGRRWLPGVSSLEKGEEPPLWLAKDSPSKFHAIFEILDDLQKWYDQRTVPETFGQRLYALYGQHHSRAGERIRTLFIDLFEDDQDAAAKAGAELPQWIAQERSDVERERELYRREAEIRANAGPGLIDAEVAKKEAALEKQIREQTRLLLQLQKARPQRDRSSGEAAGPSGTPARPEAPPEGPHASSGTHSGEPASAPAPAEASSSESAAATESGTVGVPPAKPIGAPSAGDSVHRGAEVVAEGTRAGHKTGPDWKVEVKIEKAGQSNLTSAA